MVFMDTLSEDSEIDLKEHLRDLNLDSEYKSEEQDIEMLIEDKDEEEGILKRKSKRLH